MRTHEEEKLRALLNAVVKSVTRPTRSGALDRGLYELVERQFPDLWEDLEEAGREMFVRGVLEAASHPLEDRDQTLTVVIDT